MAKCKCEICIHKEVCECLIETGLPFNDDKFPADKFCNCFKDESLIVDLPCKVGDTVYIPWEYGCTNGVAFSEVEKIVFYTPNVPRIFIKDLESDMPMPSNFCPDDFGETIFLSHEEAEKALKEYENET